MAIPVPNKEACTIATAFYNHWICQFSCPLTIVSDNGKEFVNQFAKYLFDQLGIKHYKTSVGHPQTNAAAESFNRTIIAYMKAMLDNNTLEWEELIPSMLLAYNTRIHEATKTSS